MARSPKNMAPEDRVLWLEELAVQIASAGVQGVDFLLSCLGEADTARIRAALVGLSSSKRLGARTRARILGEIEPLLEDRRAMIVAATVDALRHLECRSVVNRVRAMREHVSPFVVGSVLRYLAWYAPAAAVPLLEEALGSPKYIVRENAVDELDDMLCVTALPRIRMLLRDRHKHVREAAATAVRNLEAATRRRSG